MTAGKRRNLLDFLREKAQGDLLPWNAEAAAVWHFGLGYAEVEEIALEEGLLPARYQRNRSLLSTADQLRLLRSAVAVVGCGGLGGYVIEELARLGVGCIVAVDPDVFEEHNLNRQILSSPETLGRLKTEAAAERVSQVNPAVTLLPVPRALTLENGKELLAGVRLAVDALDSVHVRLELAAVCRDLGIPLVHGAIAGWYGQVATQFPGENLLERLYGESAAKGVERELGNPSFTPAVVASLQAAEACKVLLGKGAPLRGRILSVDLLDMEMVEMRP